MRLNHLDILEQCFRDKFRGYSKDEVDSFLELVSKDFKEMEGEIEVLTQKLRRQEGKDEHIAELRIELEEKNHIIENLQKSPGPGTELTPEIIKEKARRVLTAAKEHAELHRQKAEKELEQIREEIKQLKSEKKNVMESIKKTARDYLDNIKSKTTDRD